MCMSKSSMGGMGKMNGREGRQREGGVDEN